MVATWIRLTRRLLGLALGVLLGLLVVAAVFGRLIPLTGRTTLVVQGASMEPAIALGAAIVAEPVDPASLRVGDVVSMRVGTGRAIVSHRIVRVVDRDGSLWIETKGDANRTVDPSLIPASAVIGRVALVVPALGYLLALLSTTSGVLVALGLMGALLAASAFLGTFGKPERDAPNLLGREAIGTS